MDVVIVGGHGKIAMQLAKLLAEPRRPRPRAMIRKPEQAAELEAVGREAVVCDIEAGDADLTERSRALTRSSSPPGRGPAAGPSASAASTSAAP